MEGEACFYPSIKYAVELRRYSVGGIRKDGWLGRFYSFTNEMIVECVVVEIHSMCRPGGK